MANDVMYSSSSSRADGLSHGERALPMYGSSTTVGLRTESYSRRDVELSIFTPNTRVAESVHNVR